MARLGLFCGSATGAKLAYGAAAREVGRLLAQNGIGLVYGGSHLGLMGMAADACLEAGGEVIGVMPKFMVSREIAHRGLTELHIVESMHERKAMMAELSDAFLALPGGFGTLDEFCEIVTWAQIKIHSKPFGVLNVEGFYNHFLLQADVAEREGFVKTHHRDILLESDDVTDMLTALFPVR